VRSEVTPTSGSLDDLFLFTVTVEGVSRSAPPLLSGGNDFTLELLGSQTAISIGSNGVDPKASYFYNLKPKREGEILTPAVEIDLGGGKLTAEPIKVEIRSGARGDSPNASAGDTIGRDQLFARQSAVPSSVYQGQQVVNTVALYTQFELPQLVIEELGSDGFWQEPLVDDDRSTKVINGIEHMVVQVKKSLFPLRSGTIELPARKVRAKVPVRQRKRAGPGFGFFDDDIFGGFFDPLELKDVEITSNTASVEVIQLPPAPNEMQPFLGTVPVVGATALELSYPPDAINVGESKTVTVTVVSTGNLKPLKSLPLASQPGVKIYEERPESRIDRSRSQLVTRHSFRYSIVPLKPGLIRIPKLQLAFFDPQKKSYALAQTSDIAFPVSGKALVGADQTPTTSGAAQTPNAQARGAQGLGAQTPDNGRPRLVPTLPPVPVGPPLRYEEPTTLHKLAQQVSPQLALLLLSALTAFAGIAFVAYRLRAKRTSRSSLSASEIDRGTSSKELEQALRRLAGQRLNGVRDDSTVDEIRSMVASQVSDRELALAIRSLLDDLEVLQYGGSSEGDQDELPALRRRLKDLARQWR
jgi:HAMP domain-containing protein